MKKLFHNKKGMILLGIIVVLLIAGSMIPYFFTFKNIMNITRQSTTIALCALGMTVVLITREIDLSTGGVMAFCAMVSGTLMLRGVPVLLSILAGLVVGAGMGWVNGVLHALIEIPSFIATYVIGQVTVGLALILCKGRSIGGMPDSYEMLGNSTFARIPIMTFIMILFFLLTALILSHTPMGKHIYALGGNETTVRQVGIKVSRVKLFAFMFSGICAALAGILLSAQMNTVHPTQGSTYQLDAVAASVIGGVSMLGGEGKAWMPVVGALLISLLRNALTLLGLHPYFQNLAVGGTIIVVVGVSVFNRGKVLEQAKTY